MNHNLPPSKRPFANITRKKEKKNVLDGSSARKGWWTQSAKKSTQPIWNAYQMALTRAARWRQTVSQIKRTNDTSD